MRWYDIHKFKKIVLEYNFLEEQNLPIEIFVSFVWFWYPRSTFIVIIISNKVVIFEFFAWFNVLWKCSQCVWWCSHEVGGNLQGSMIFHPSSATGSSFDDIDDSYIMYTSFTNKYMNMNIIFIKINIFITIFKNDWILVRI